MKKTKVAKKPRSYERKKSRAGFLFILPWIIGTVFFFLLPAAKSILYSVGKISYAEGGMNIAFVGLEHFRYMLEEDSQFIPLLTTSLPAMFYQVPLVVLLSLFLALIINQKFFGRAVVRTIFFLPVIIASGIVISIMRGDVFSQMLMSNASASNLFNGEMLSILLKELDVGASVVRFISGMVDKIFELIWNVGIQTLLFLTALQGIPTSMYEAASIEGGTGWENFWKITFPMVSPMILVNVIFTIIDTFNNYTNRVTSYINTFATGAAFEYASALSWVYALLSLVVIVVFYFVINKFVYYET